MQKNSERFEFLKYVDASFDNITVIPPGTGIIFGHLWSKMVYIQIDIKYLKSAARILIFWLQVKG